MAIAVALSEIYDNFLVISSLMLTWQAFMKDVMVDDIDDCLEALRLLGKPDYQSFFGCHTLNIFVV